MFPLTICLKRILGLYEADIIDFTGVEAVLWRI